MDTGFVFQTLAARVVLGDGALQRVAGELERLGAERAVVVAGARHRAAAARLSAALGDASVGVFTEVAPHVPEELAARLRDVVSRRGADAVVSIGGGSAIGLAKAVARSRPLTVVAVPTTYSGSEMTPIWGTTAGRRKRTGRDPAVLPSVVVYDPELTRSLPAPLAAASGLNAVAHCVEALYAPGHNPITDLAAVEGLRRLAAALPRVGGAGSDPSALREALYGACLAGLALAQAGTSFHHRVCHVLGGRFDLPHAETHAVLLPHSARAAAAVAPRALGPVASALRAEEAPAGIAALAERLGAPTSLAQLGLSEGDLEEAIDLASAALAGAEPAPSHDGLVRLLRDAWSGRAGDGRPGRAAPDPRRPRGPGHQI